MSMEQIYETLNEIFQDVFDDDDITVSAETTAADIEGWDSLANINIVTLIEDEFDFKFTMSEITGLKNVGEMAALIAERTA